MSAIDYFACIGAASPLKYIGNITGTGVDIRNNGNTGTRHNSISSASSTGTGNGAIIHNSSTLEESYNSAITELAVMFPDENDVLTKEEGWEIVDFYNFEKDEFIPVDRSSQYPVILLKRRKHSRRIDHIIDVCYLY